MKTNTRTILFALAMLALGLGIFALNSGGSSGVALAQGPRTGGSRAPASSSLGTGFTYQGQLKSSGAPVNGTCTLAFRLFDDASTGNQIGSPITQTIPITNGLFTTQLNAGNEFGAAAFNGDARWLEIRVSNACPSAGSFTTLDPREPITPAPYALTAMKTAYKNVLVVAKSGGHYNTISAALASISDNGSTNRYLVWVAPGDYFETVTMKPYVDIEGAGELATKIVQVGSSLGYTGTVAGADNAELRFLTVANTGGTTEAVAIYNSSASPRLTHVTAAASGGSYSYGVYNTSSSPLMTNVTASASGSNAAYGVRNESSSPTMTNVTAAASAAGSSFGINNLNASPTMTTVTAVASGGGTNNGIYNFNTSPMINNSAFAASGGTSNYGIYNYASAGTYTVTVNNSQITASTNTIFNDYGSNNYTTRVGGSLLSGGVVTGTGTLVCAGVWDENYTFYASTCP